MGSLISSLRFVTIRSSMASLLVELLPGLRIYASCISGISWVAYTSLLLFQQTLRWLKSPRRTRTCECDPSCSWNKKVSSIGQGPVVTPSTKFPLLPHSLFLTHRLLPAHFCSSVQRLFFRDGSSHSIHFWM